MRTTIFFVGFCLLITICGPAVQAQTVINATSCSQAALQTAWNQMSSGSYVIVLPACEVGGSGVWTSTLSLTVPANVASVTIQGQTAVNCTGTAGTSNYVCTATDNTVISDGATGTSSNLITFNTGGASVLFRITGITVQGGTGTAKNQMIQIGGGTTNLRVDHCHFNPTTYSFSANAVITLYGTLEGVFDHNLFNLGNGGNYTNGIQVYAGQLDTIGRGDGSWAAPSSWGSQHAIFAENNTYVGGYTDDCNLGGHLVTRYNAITVVNAGVQAHPTYSGGGRDRGCRTLEVYHNYFSTNSTSPDPNAFGMRGGTGLFWENIITSNFKAVLGVYTDRATADHNESPAPTQNPEGWGYCGTAPANNGSGSSWDGNSTTTTGYPCLDGVGRGQGQALNGADFKPYSSTGPLNTATGAKTWPHEYLEPVYVWGTTNNGVPLLSLQDTVTQNNRDVYVDSASFNGTSGTGQGLLSSRPATCTAGPGGTYGQSPTGSYGVAYFATDNQTLYVCTAANTWTAIYTPYVYPHPLIAGGGVSGNAPNPPTGLAVTVQ